MMRNPNAPHINFEEFSGMLGKIIPSNIDMVMERRGYFLIGEWKRPNEKVSKGQEILLKAFAKLDKFTVLIITGDTDNEMTVHKFWKINKYGNLSLAGSSVEQLKDFITDWYLLADLQPVPLTPNDS